MPTRQPTDARDAPTVALARASGWLVVLFVLCYWTGTSVFAADAGLTQLRLERIAVYPQVAATWVETDGQHVAFGAGTQVLVAAGVRAPLVPKFEITVESPVTDAAWAGRYLYLALADGALVAVDVESSHRPVLPVRGAPATAAPMRIAISGGLLVTGNRSSGLSWFRRPSSMHHAGQHHGEHRRHLELELVARVPLEEPLRDLEAVPGRVHVLTQSGRLLDFDIANPLAPVVQAAPRLDPATLALARRSTDILAVGAAGLQQLVTAPARAPRKGAHHRRVRGQAIDAAGRVVYVAGGKEGLIVYYDKSPSAQLHLVFVNDDFFTPENIAIDVGDTVRWSNAAGFHNVYSCEVEQAGCEEGRDTGELTGEWLISSEVFTNGPPAVGPWIFLHTFTEAGINPYVCQSHASFMWGEIEVSAPEVVPTPVPDGSVGTPMTVDKNDPQGESLSLAWDNLTCPNMGSQQILYGNGSQFPPSPSEAYGLMGAVCGAGIGNWEGSPDPSADPSGLVWWIVVNTDGNGVEGSWGVNAAGERSGPGAAGASGECGVTGKDSSGTCP